MDVIQNSDCSASHLYVFIESVMGWLFIWLIARIRRNSHPPSTGFFVLGKKCSFSLLYTDIAVERNTSLSDVLSKWHWYA